MVWHWQVMVPASRSAMTIFPQTPHSVFLKYRFKFCLSWSGFAGLSTCSWMFGCSCRFQSSRMLGRPESWLGWSSAFAVEGSPCVCFGDRRFGRFHSPWFQSWTPTFPQSLQTCRSKLVVMVLLTLIVSRRGLLQNRQSGFGLLLMFSAPLVLLLGSWA
jgi:hypothetical protein